MIDQHRNPRFWQQVSPGKWVWRAHPSEGSEPVDGVIDFKSHRTFEGEDRRGYIIVGKGYPA
jgi:hypothetical protein